MEFILFFIGVFLGVSITSIIFRSHFIGDLRIDNSDPEDGPYIFLELSKRIGNISSKKYVVLKVKLENFIPQK
ncbi:MAG TPA: hypothetical protein PKK61_05975 [Defluviitaleaceae bacterium]|nr:hypothetical protein [Defluviitaleaceae bacterium]